MKPIRWLIAGVLSALLGGLALAEDQPVDDLDLIYLGFQSRRLSSGAGAVPQLDGYFVAIKFWLLDASGIPAEQPTALYATAYLTGPGGSTQPLLRASFNGTRLLERNERFGPIYHIKRPPDPREKWISWYAHLSERTFPKSFAFDNLLGRGPFDLIFPSAYKLVVPDRAVMGSAELTVSASALDPTLPTPADAQIKLFPSRVPGALQTTIYYGENVEPTRPSITFPRSDAVANGGGWNYGSQAGLAGFSACNQKVMRFDGGAGVKQFLFRACTVMVKPIELVMERTR